jgi:hypothetical protein
VASWTVNPLTVELAASVQDRFTLAWVGLVASGRASRFVGAAGGCITRKVATFDHTE